MTAPRIIVPGATYALTQRCVLRKFLLTPMSEVVNQLYGYCLGLALEETSAELHHGCGMPNHGHTCVTVEEADLPDFMRTFHGQLSKAMKVALAEHGYEPPESIFRNERPSVVRQMDEGSLLRILHYQDMNPVKAGLVARVDDYPGFATPLQAMKGRVLVFKRPDFYFDPRNNPNEIEVRICLPPLLQQSYDPEQVIYHLLRARRQAESELAARRTRPVLGAAAIVAMNPWSEPRSPRRLSKGPKPTFRATDPKLAAEYAEQVQLFRKRYRSARETRLAGEPALFPYGTYAMRVLHNVPVDEPPEAGSLGVDAPGLALVDADVDGGEAQLRKLGKQERVAITSELYRASAEAIENFDPDDSLAARLTDGRADEVEREDGPQPGVEGERRAQKLVTLRQSSASAKRRRRQIQSERAVEAHSQAPLAGSGPDDFDPNPPPH